jgi:hypothetical protein
MSTKSLDFLKRSSNLDILGFVQKFRKRMYDDLNCFESFCKDHDEYMGGLVKGVNERQIKKISLICIAGYCVLSDKDFDGELIDIVNNSDFHSLALFYDSSTNYGITMTAFSKYIGLEGESLREYIFDDGLDH